MLICSPPSWQGSRSLPPETIAVSSQVLAKAAVAFGVPITSSIVPENGEPGSLTPELRAFSTEQNTISRFTADAFLDTPTVEALAVHDRKHLIIAGFAAEVVALYSALSAMRAGQCVHLALDAIGGRSERTEAAALKQIESNGGIPSSVLSLITGLAPDFSKHPGTLVPPLITALRRGA